MEEEGRAGRGGGGACDTATPAAAGCVWMEIGSPALAASPAWPLPCQGIVLPQIVTGVAANLVNALANYLFLYQLHLGVMGSALANMISQFTLALLLFLYILLKKLHQDTWGGEGCCP